MNIKLKNRLCQCLVLGAILTFSFQLSFANSGRVAFIADGNSPDPDDLGATSAALAMLRASGFEKKLVHCSHSCDLVNNTGRITDEQELMRQGLLQDACDDTAAEWGGFDHLTFWNCRTQQAEAVTDLAAAINASSVEDPLWIILAGEPDIIYFALKEAKSDKSKFVTIITHHPVNDNSGDFHNLSDIEHDFHVSVARIPDQNIKLNTKKSAWDWARDHNDSRINEIWKHGDIAERDGIHKAQNGRFDISDAGMVYYWITGASEGGVRQPTVQQVKTMLLQYVQDNP